MQEQALECAGGTRAADGNKLSRVAGDFESLAYLMKPTETGTGRLREGELAGVKIVPGEAKKSFVINKNAQKRSQTELKRSREVQP
jgi:hypothetical protein